MSCSYQNELNGRIRILVRGFGRADLGGQDPEDLEEKSHFFDHLVGVEEVQVVVVVKLVARNEQMSFRGR